MNGHEDRVAIGQIAAEVEALEKKLASADPLLYGWTTRGSWWDEVEGQLEAAASRVRDLASLPEATDKQVSAEIGLRVEALALELQTAANLIDARGAQMYRDAMLQKLAEVLMPLVRDVAGRVLSGVKARVLGGAPP